MSSRMERIELMMADLHENLSQRLEPPSMRREAQPRVAFSPSTSFRPKVAASLSPPPRRAGALRKPAATSGALDPALVAAATQAGVERETLDEVTQLMMKNVKAQKVKDMSVGLQPDPLSNAEEEDFEEGDATTGAGASALAGGGPLQPAVLSLSEIMKSLTDDKMKARASKIENALEYSGASSSETVAVGSGKRSAAARRALSSRGAIWPAGTPHDGGPDVADLGPWYAYPCSFIQGLGRAPLAHWGLQGHCPLRLGHSRGSGLPGSWTSSCSPSATQHHLAPDRPGFLRSGQLDSCFRAFLGAPAPFHLAATTFSSWRGRASLQPAPRPTLGRGSNGIPSGAGRFPVQAEGPRQEHQEGRWGGRRRFPEETLKAEGQNQGVFRGGRVRSVSLAALHVLAVVLGPPGAKLPGDGDGPFWSTAVSNSFWLQPWMIPVSLHAFCRSMLKKPKKPYRTSTSAFGSFLWLLPLRWAVGFVDAACLLVPHVRRLCRLWLLFAALSMWRCAGLCVAPAVLCPGAAFGAAVGGRVLLPEPLCGQCFF